MYIPMSARMTAARQTMIGRNGEAGDFTLMV
jgi:hypothetical protein